MKLVKIDGIPTVSHRVIAENTANKAESLRDIITRYSYDFEEFGVCRFEIAKPQKGSQGGKPSKTYYLNEQQAYLLMTYLKNTEIVRKFKVALVKAFFEMREELLKSNNFLNENTQLKGRVTELQKEIEYIKELAIANLKDIEIEALKSANTVQFASLDYVKTNKINFKFIQSLCEKVSFYASFGIDSFLRRTNFLEKSKHDIDT